MNEETPMMTCDWCGKEFPADARACVEAGISGGPEVDEGEEWKEGAMPLSSEDLSPLQRVWMKTELGLDDAQLDTLLRTGKLEGLGAIVCVQCQDDGEEVE
jgi:hypothetical protein